MKLNSIVFHTSKIQQIRDFYEGILNFPTGTYVRENKTVPDYSENHVNYYIDGALLGFEYDETQTNVGTIVLNVSNILEQKSVLKKMASESSLEILNS